MSPGRQCAYVGPKKRCRWCEQWAPLCTEVDDNGKIQHSFNPALPGERGRRCTKCGRLPRESGSKKRKRESDPEKRKQLKEGTDEKARADRRQRENGTEAQQQRLKDLHQNRNAQK